MTKGTEGKDDAARALAKEASDRKRVIREAQTNLRKAAPSMSLRGAHGSSLSAAEMAEKFCRHISQRRETNINRIVRMHSSSASASIAEVDRACITVVESPAHQTGGADASSSGGVPPLIAGSNSAFVAVPSSVVETQTCDEANLLLDGVTSAVAVASSQAIECPTPPDLTESMPAIATVGSQSAAGGGESVSIVTLQALLGAKRRRIEVDGANRGKHPVDPTAAPNTDDDNDEHVAALLRKHERKRLHQLAVTAALNAEASSTGVSPTSVGGESTAAAAFPPVAKHAPVGAPPPSMLLALQIDKRSSAGATSVEALLRQSSATEADRLRRHNSFEQTASRAVVFEHRVHSKPPPNSPLSPHVSHSFSA